MTFLQEKKIKEIIEDVCCNYYHPNTNTVKVVNQAFAKIEKVLKIDEGKVAKIIYSQVNLYLNSPKFNKHNLKNYDNWKDNIAEKIAESDIYEDKNPEDYTTSELFNNSIEEPLK